MIVAEHLAAGLAALLREDPRRLLLGEDVADGGVFGLSRAALGDPELAARICATPLTPGIAPAHAGGLALAGRRPIVALTAVTSLLEGFSALRELCRLALVGEAAPVLFLAPAGPGVGLGGDGAEECADALATIPGLRLVSAGDPRELTALVLACAAFGEGEAPCVVLLPRAHLIADIDDPALALDRRPGSIREYPADGAEEAVVLSWGACVERARAAAQASGHAVAVVDIGGLAPLDREGVVAAACRTGKVVIAHGGRAEHGVGAELAALCADAAILHLDAPVVRVCGEPGPWPRAHEDRALPPVAAIAAAIDRVVTY